MISFSDIAFQMEVLCERVDEGEDIDALFQEMFANAHEELKTAVDRRVKFLKYAESQIAMAKSMRDEWASRVDRFEETIASLKKNTIEVMKANPGIPYKGNIGAFKIYKNSQPAMSLGDMVQLDRLNIEIVGTVKVEEDHNLGEYISFKKFMVLDKARLKEDLKNGKEIPGVSLEYGEHVRVNLNV